jgi:CheY-like chemotaxis protein
MTERGKRPSVLIADDESDIRLIVGLNLDLLEVDYDEAGDGEEAIEMLGSREWDGCIIDIAMPKVDGLEVIEWLAEHNLHTKIAIMVLSAKGSPSAALEALKLGAHAHISKPFSPPAVAKMLQDLISLAPEERAARRDQMLERASNLNRLGIPTV